MRGRIFVALAGTLALTLGVLIFSATVTAQRITPPQGARKAPSTDSQVYFPYPPGIVPSDVVPEIERVRREVRFIYQQAVAEWHALPPITPTGQPPTLQGAGYTPV